MKKPILGTLAATLFIIPLARASADPLRWAGNGHYYEVMSVPGTISWEEANAAATAAGGYLATLTSPAENSFVFSLVNNAAYWHGYSGPWLGGYQSPATSQPTANWHWVTGEAWSYTNWQAGQPNHSGGKPEDKLQFGFGVRVSTWNDIMSADPVADYRPIAYVVEWTENPQQPPLAIRHFQPAQVELSWQTATNKFYQVLYSSTLHPAQWAPLTTDWVAGDGASHSETDATLPDNSARFYRLVLTNAVSR